MKTLPIISICSLALAVSAFAQNPAATQAASSAPAISISATPSASASPSDDLADRIQQRLEKKFRGHHGVVIGDHDAEGIASGDIPGEVIPIVAITMLTVFGAPVLIVAVIMLINYARARSLHRTVQTMVEKGQPVPAALLAPPAVPRPRSDLRRGVILIAIGISVMTFFVIDEGWHDSAWAFGLIPGLIGVGYLIVWKLEGKKDNPPPVS
jgi:hypothetical protein